MKLCGWRASQVSPAPLPATIAIRRDVVAGNTYYYSLIFDYTDLRGNTHQSPRSNVASSLATCPPPPRGPMDVAFILDNTFSMRFSFANLQNGISSVLNDIITASGNDYRLALVTPDTEMVNVRLNFSQNNRTDFENQLAPIVAQGRAQDPESTDECLNTVVNHLPAAGRPQQVNDFSPAFRTDSNVLKLVVLITDQVPGGFDDFFDPNVDPQNAHQYAVSAKSQCIKINAIQVGTDIPTTPIMHDYAHTSCGWFEFVASDGTGIEDAILEMIYTNGECSCP